ncbi:MAG: hypothetical protein FWC07_10705, partial [Defluviitaleaceae bacterium]|nr:hypothetical protein [Defluviitaleaceae bacterium]
HGGVMWLVFGIYDKHNHFPDKANHPATSTSAGITPAIDALPLPAYNGGASIRGKLEESHEA